MKNQKQIRLSSALSTGSLPGYSNCQKLKITNENDKRERFEEDSVDFNRVDYGLINYFGVQ